MNGFCVVLCNINILNSNLCIIEDGLYVVLLLNYRLQCSLVYQILVMFRLMMDFEEEFLRLWLFVGEFLGMQFFFCIFFFSLQCYRIIF